MSLSAYNFKFYSYNMPTQRTACNGMDVDDIDMSIPPPKPPRAYTVYNSNATTQLSWMSSTPKSIVSENQIMARPVATSTATAAVNYLTDSNETPKSNYFSSMLKGAAASVSATAQPAKTTELQLRPKLHATQKRWSFELKEKALEMSKRCSGGMDEENPQTANHLPMQDVEEPLQLKPQHHAGRKSWSSDIRQKPFEMSKRNSGSLKSSPGSVAKIMQYFGVNSTGSKVNEQNPLNFQIPPNETRQTPLINAAACEQITSTTGGIKTETPQSRSTLGAYFKAPQQANATFVGDSATKNHDQTQSVKDRIWFFNKLTTRHSNSFIDLLKNSKTTNTASIQHSTSEQNTPLSTPLKPKRWSTHLELHLQQDDVVSTQFTQIQTNQVSTKAAAPALLKLPSSSSTSLASSSTSSSASLITYSNYSTTSAQQRKSSLRRRTSVDKSRRPILRQNSTAGSNGTKPQMHTVMEDLSLVMPVKLRVAEYERRIMMQC